MSNLDIPVYNCCCFYEIHQKVLYEGKIVEAKDVIGAHLLKEVKVCAEYKIPVCDLKLIDENSAKDFFKHELAIRIANELLKYPEIIKERISDNGNGITLNVNLICKATI